MALLVSVYDACLPECSVPNATLRDAVGLRVGHAPRGLMRATQDPGGCPQEAHAQIQRSAEPGRPFSGNPLKVFRVHSLTARITASKVTHLQ